MRAGSVPVALGLLLTGCNYLGTSRGFDPQMAEPGLALLPTMESIRQQSENDCGPAALTMVLHYWGDPITLGESLVALPPRDGGGVTAGALRDFAKGRGYNAYVFEGKIEDLEHQIAKGRPLIVGMIKPYLDKARCHFEVVCGVHKEKQYVVTLDPATGWMRNTLEGFLIEWTAAGRPTLLIAKAAAVPTPPPK